jgi:hypothetical protein
MDNVLDISPVMIFVLAIIAVALVTGAASQRRRRRWWPQGRPCGHCGQIHPAFARFCRRCGARL